VYGDTANARALMLQELSSLAEANPALRDKMVFPQMPMSSLRNLFVQRCDSKHSCSSSPHADPWPVQYSIKRWTRSLQWQSATGGGGGRASADGLKLANGQFRPRLEGAV